LDAGYAEAELVENRVPVLLFGGSLADRQAWAEEAAVRLGGTFTVVATAEELPGALARKEGVVLLADALSLGDAAQAQLLRCLQQEERPKLVLGLSRSADAALAGGELRADVHYRLRRSQVNLDAPGLRETIARRRARGPGAARREAAPPSTSAPRTSTPARRPAKAKRHHAPKKGKRRAAASKRRRR
jgi:hypothetical protein